MTRRFLQSNFVFVHDTAAPTTTNQVQKQQSAGGVRVPLITLDDCRGRWASKSVGLLKVDVEGFEPQVFAGAVEFLSQDRPRLIMFESLGGRVLPEIQKAFADANYRVFQLGGDGLPDFSASTLQNLFAVPSERADQLKRAPC